MNSKNNLFFLIALVGLLALGGVGLFLVISSSKSEGNKTDVNLPTAISNGTTVASNDQNVSESRFSKLSKGINLSRWFTDPLEPNNPNFFRTFITKKDIELIRDLGFKHVRLPIDPTYFFDEKNPAMLDPAMKGHLDAALDLILQNNLAVIVDFHPLSKEYKKRLAREAGLRASLVTSWGALAKYLSGRNPEQLFLETLNEPAFEETFTGDGKTTQEAVITWWQFQKELVTAMRANAPQHTIIVNTHEYGLVAELAFVDKYKIALPNDKNLVYNFHFYLPFFFTHQAADWALPEGDAEYWKDVPYPATLKNCQAQISKLKAAERFTKFCGENWDKAKLEAEIRPAYEWATRNDVRMTVNEFGVYREAAPKYRTAWLRDTRQIFEQFGFGWSMWDYADGFGLMQVDDAKRRTLDRETLQALGL